MASQTPTYPSDASAATFLLTVSLWQAIRILTDPNPARCAAWAGAFAGLSAGTKYTGALMLLAIGVAWWLRSPSSIDGVRAKPTSGWLWPIGGFLLALQTGLPIVPISVVGSRHVMRKGQLTTKPGRVTLVVHAPIEVPPHADDTPQVGEVRSFADRVREVIRPAVELEAVAGDKTR